MVTTEIDLEKKIVVVDKGAAKEININTMAGEGDPDLGPINDMKDQTEETEEIEAKEEIEVKEIGVIGETEVTEVTGEIETKGVIEVVIDISAISDTIGQIGIEDKVEATQGIVIKS